MYDFKAELLYTTTHENATQSSLFWSLSHAYMWSVIKDGNEKRATTFYSRRNRTVDFSMSSLSFTSSRIIEFIMFNKCCSTSLFPSRILFHAFAHCIATVGLCALCMHGRTGIMHTNGTCSSPSSLQLHISNFLIFEIFQLRADS